MSNSDPVTTLIDSLKGLSFDDQWTKLRGHINSLPTVEAEFEFVGHPAVKAWISANVTAINQKVVIPKSHGGPA